jgi:hypothetical protein
MKKKKNVLLSLNKKKVSELNNSVSHKIIGGSGSCGSGTWTWYGCSPSGDCGGTGGGGGSVYTWSPACISLAIC